MPDLLAASALRARCAAVTSGRGWPERRAPSSRTTCFPSAQSTGERRQAAARRGAWRPLVEAGGQLLETLSVVLEQSSSLEGAARLLFVHPNTVRYRLRRIADVTGLSPMDERAALSLRVALILGRLEDAAHA